MKIGILQNNPIAGDLTGNAAALLAAVRNAASTGADVCIAPELALCAHPPSDLLLSESFIVACGKTLQAMAQTLQSESLPPLLLGAPVANPVPQGKSIHNGAVFLRDGKVIVICRKVLLPCEGSREDQRYFEPGVACGMVQYKGWRLAVTIGEDIWNDRTFWHGRRTYETDPVAEAMTSGADGLINLAALPFQIGGDYLHERMLGWSAVRYRVPLLCANQAGGQDGLIYGGKSVCFSPYGAVTARAAAFAEDVLLVDLVKPGDPIDAPAPSDEADIWAALTLGIRDFVRKCGFSSVVLGLSGGMDSALVAALAVDALGPENVLGVLLPSPFTSGESIDVAEKLAANLGIKTHTVPIEPMMRAFEGAFEPVFAGRKRDVTEDNLQARIRGTVLMSLSNKFGHMLLNTGNKSEIAMGYCTLYGDSCGALAVIGDLYKTQVFSLARWYNQRQGHDRIPQFIIDRPPSAELHPDQKDEDSLPPYDVLDKILYDHIEMRMGFDTLCEVGHAPEVVKRTLHLLTIAEFKRHQGPPALCVSQRAFGSGWRMRIACKPAQ
ncbi:putative glutamine-dependent NAD(+) synthetase [uncultured delta proteobacterium]|uniref:Glutamine-dependent NAD(+) synthetase n=1 Tax=uncultured delta proteobacterium TaxID=34034 RepID=A0A212J223_9DELT|nr:putative glutamine-dependent NAD(+) synthetase [uncultured delta proteobacterium]